MPAWEIAAAEWMFYTGARMPARERSSARSLFEMESVAVRTQVISARRDFDRLIQGFQTLRAISYVVSPDLLVELFDSSGLQHAEVIVGENLSGMGLVDQYRQQLQRKGEHATTRLAELVRENRLRILVPRRCIHSKLYILQNASACRVVQGSANLTETARTATSQVNYVWYADLSPDDPWLAQVQSDYDTHTSDCQLFMGDLADLLRHRTDADTQSLVESWLSGSDAEPQDSEFRMALQELTAKSIQQAQNSDPLFTISLPDAPRAKREVERMLVPLGATSTDHHMTVDSHAYLRYVERTLPVPLLRVDVGAGAVHLVLAGEVRSRSEYLPEDPAEVDRALAHLEEYVSTVDWGRSLDSRFAKSSLFEALLFVLSAPFAHEHMKVRRARYALIDRRGPPALFVFGPSQNGKSTFLRFALQLLTGEHVAGALPGEQFTKTRVVSAASTGTVFPLAFDDVDLVKKGRVFEEVLKSYWETWWQQDCPVPQLMFTSNSDNLKDWAKSRTKRIDFDVHFVPTEQRKTDLNRILAEQNPIFRWFAHLYVRELQRGIEASDDGLSTARAVMRELYAHAGRVAPEFFSDRPLEQTYDPGRKVWHDLLYGLRKAEAQRQKLRLLITFKDEMQHGEIRGALGHLPQTIKHQLKGKTVVIESPAEFDAWLNPARSDLSWPSRLWSRLRGAKAHVNGS